jgi:hypothetical protein
MGKWKYFRELYQLSLKETKEQLGTRGAGLILALKILGAAFAIFLLITLGRLEENEPVYETVYTIFIGDIIGFAVLFIISPMLALLKIPTMAYQRDSAQTEKITQYEKDLQRKTLNLYVDHGRNINIDVGGGVPRVTLTIDVINNEPRKIVDLEAYVMSIDQLTEELPDDWSFTISISSFRAKRMEWKDKKYIIDLTPGFPETFVKIVYLDCSNSEVMFINEQMRKIPDLSRSALYKIRIEFKGKLEGENPDYRFFDYVTMFYCEPSSSQIGYVSDEVDNPNLSDWLNGRIKLETDRAREKA